MTWVENIPYNWSQEFAFTRESIVKNAPVSSGVYEILQSVEYPSYQGKTRILKIGKSESDLKTELLNHLSRHTASNRLARIQRRAKIQISFIYLSISPEDASKAERDLLRKFEDEHWDIPVINSQRGYSRGEDIHFRGQ